MNSPKKVNLFMMIYFIWEITGVQIFITIAAYAIMYLFPDISTKDYCINLMIIQDAVLLLLPILLGIKLLGERAPEVISLKGLSLWNIVYIVMTGFLRLPVMQFISVITSFFCPDTSGEIQDAVLSADFSVGLLIMAVLPAILEETLFRGLIYGSLRKFGTKKAMVLSAFYFGLFHLSGYQIPYAVLSGIILAIVTEYGGSIIAPMLLHFTINGTQVASYYYYSSTLAGLSETAETAITVSDIAYLGIIAAVFLVLLILTLKGFIRYNKKEREKAKREVFISEMPEEKEKTRFTDIYFVINILLVG
ncbi:MAG: CPBP family intramembrane metalloprotease, partial [Clostridiales bacterium]|nr:CPBP family intramembrane metalloprotease [Clostridiales bacterium]